MDELIEEPAKVLGVVWLLRRTALLAVVPSVVVALYSRDVDRHCVCDHLARAAGWRRGGWKIAAAVVLHGFWDWRGLSLPWTFGWIEIL